MNSNKRDKNEIILQKIYKEKEPASEELEGIFPSLFSKETLKILETREPILQQQASNTSFVIPQIPAWAYKPNFKYSNKRKLFSYTELDIDSSRRKLPSLFSSGSISGIHDLASPVIQSLRYKIGEPPPIDIQPESLFHEVAKRLSNNFNASQRPSFVAILLSIESCKILETTFWFVQTHLFRPRDPVTDEVEEKLLQELGEQFSELVVSTRKGKEEFYHYAIAKGVYEGFLSSFPKAKDQLTPDFKQHVYKLVFSFYVGDLFTFDFHLDMLRDLFGDGEVRDIVRGNTRKSQEMEGGLLNQTHSNGLAADVANSKLANIWSKGAQNIDWRALDLLENPEEFLRIPVYWHKFTLFSGYARLTWKNYNTYLTSPLMQRYFHSDNPLKKFRKGLQTEVSSTAKEESRSYRHAELLEAQRTLRNSYAKSQKELQKELEESQLKLSKSLNISKIEEMNVTSSRPEEVHRYAGNLVREKLDKERKQKTIQTNIEEFDQGIADRLLDEELEKRASSWFTKPLTEVLLPTDWSLMESLKNIRESKGKLTDLAKVKEKKRGISQIPEEMKNFHKLESDA